MTRTTTTATMTKTVHRAQPVSLPARGRHRKPRPRRLLFAVGGFALAAGALGVAGLLPEPVGGGGAGQTGTEPRAAADGVQERQGPGNAAATMEAVPPRRDSSNSGSGIGSASGARPTSGPTAMESPSPDSTSPALMAAARPAGPIGA
ncbi:hypothetical protein FNH04_45715, partial [Streptomyces phyllanthi]|nr:hypothetical protein [Streptomyces phyllanthi]